MVQMTGLQSSCRESVNNQGAAATGVRNLNVDSSNIRELTNAVTEQLRQDAAATSNRRGNR